MASKRVNYLYVVSSIIFLVIFLFILLDYLYFRFLLNPDIVLNGALESIRSPMLNQIMTGITSIMNEIYFMLISIILLASLVYFRRIRLALFSFLALAGSYIIENLLKIGIHRARPFGIIPETGYSFPSGHAVMASVFFSLLIYCFKDDIKNRVLRYVFIIFCVVMALLIGFSRIYLGVHWFSDVLAGFSLGLFWIFLMLFVFNISKK